MKLKNIKNTGDKPLNPYCKRWHILIRKFGITEVDDTLEFISKMRNYPYVDDARIAIWGWSYGGKRLDIICPSYLQIYNEICNRYTYN